MQKDFDSWTIHKKKTNLNKGRTFFKEREIWWCSIGLNVGDEEDGKGKTFSRPVLVLKKFNHSTFLGIPLSTQIKENRFYYKLHFKGIEQCALFSQIRVFDAKRLGVKMGSITSNEFNKIKESLRGLVF
jgi:mRNA interferase MazF